MGLARYLAKNCKLPLSALVWLASWLLVSLLFMHVIDPYFLYYSRSGFASFSIFCFVFVFERMASNFVFERPILSAVVWPVVLTVVPWVSLYNGTVPLCTAALAR